MISVPPPAPEEAGVLLGAEVSRNRRQQLNGKFDQPEVRLQHGKPPRLVRGVCYNTCALGGLFHVFTPRAMCRLAAKAQKVELLGL